MEASAGPIVCQSVAAPPATKRVFTFGKGRSEGHKGMKDLLGGKGANLAEMCSIGLSVPPGLTISTDTCAQFHQNGRKLPPGVWEEVLEALRVVEGDMGRRLGDEERPLLVSVRSGAAVSMPGMMDTVLNLGLNDRVVEGLAAISGERFAFDSYRRFIDMFGGVVMGVPHGRFEGALERRKRASGAAADTDLTTEDLKALVAEYKEVYRHETGTEFPTDPLDQLKLSVAAVFESWHCSRAIKYRAINRISDLRGTAVNVQAMVFGNMGEGSGTGVLFTRNPSTGERRLYGEYLVNAQGEDVVAGIRTPQDIDSMRRVLPEAYEELVRNCDLLEAHYRDMMDIEFTVQEGRLWMLQCRSGKRTGGGAVRLAVEMVNEKLISEKEAVMRVEPGHLAQLLHPQFAAPTGKEYKEAVLAKGLPASPGAAVGQIVFFPEDAEEMHAAGKAAILVRMETSPEDVGGMHASAGILTARGGMTSHAAVVARGWGKCCVAGCGAVRVDEHARTVTMNGVTLREGDWVSLNGTTGEVLRGKQQLAPPALSGDLGALMAWVDGCREMKVMANADTPEDALAARSNGAQGIGLCRTEHMFFASDERIAAVRSMIMAGSQQQRQKALDRLLPFQRADFEGIFQAMDGLPVTIRLLDPPLHEFLPEGDVSDMVAAMAADVSEHVDEAEVLARIEELSEVNPMLGFRGCRLGIAYPELSTMQARAIFEAAATVMSKGGVVHPEIMVPLVSSPQELEHQVAVVRAAAAEVQQRMGVLVPFKVGTMIEIPRAALLADEIAAHADFFSFGTNDLTQMTFGFSRDDVGKFLPKYIEQGILENDPFEVLDVKGVGQLIRMATKLGRATRPDLKVGVCGEQGGEPSSVEFFAEIGFDYVSCSPFRVPIARLAAAQAALKRSAQ